ncbi:hypothetical protein [Dermabacter vaginalis]|uniref:Secreted protein n=1 Tax=Dermabacter vaginalis TaxID=1630135 RepID=A0ABX6A2N3_9MICO|nr:hypothetical protein [Dermabacter vaginalis]QEU11129.1 hypothetical protein FOB48_01635 [Dermabacter vaginalis]
MSTFMRKNRSVSIIAAAGVLAFGLAGCGASNEAKKDDSASKESTTASETKDDSTSSESSASASDEGSDSGSGAVTGDDVASSVHGTPVELDETPFTDEDKQKGAQVVADFFTSSLDKKFEDACTNMVARNGDAYERMDTPEIREQCSAQNERVLSSQGISEDQAEQMKQMLTPENIEIEPNGDGTAKATFQGQDLGISLLKVKGVGPLIDMRNLPS